MTLSEGEQLRFHQRLANFEKQMKIYRFLLASTLIIGGLICLN